MLLFVCILTGISGYALLYAGVKGDKATIGGVPLWQKPWLPFLVAIKGPNGLAKSVFQTSPSPLVGEIQGQNNAQQQQSQSQQQSSGSSPLRDFVKGLFENLGELA